MGVLGLAKAFCMAYFGEGDLKYPKLSYYFLDNQMQIIVSFSNFISYLWHIKVYTSDSENIWFFGDNIRHIFSSQIICDLPQISQKVCHIDKMNTGLMDAIFFRFNSYLYIYSRIKSKMACRWKYLTELHERY